MRRISLLPFTTLAEAGFDERAVQVKRRDLGEAFRCEVGCMETRRARPERLEPMKHRIRFRARRRVGGPVFGEEWMN